MNVRDGNVLSEDPYGKVFADVAAARKEALEIARDMLKDAVIINQKEQGFQYEIADEDGLIVAIIPFNCIV